ncbi:MAG TPA: DUF998 domain-containing protein [Ktedonobacteraceae bacterium]|nr:DUF998 domain-containing protein [Ktedonobacteraceae bacterium]
MIKEKKQSINQLMITRFLIACGAIGPLFFIVVFLIEGVTRSNYNAWHNFVSDLSMGQQGWEQIGNFLVCGVLMLCFALGIRRVLQSGKGSVWGPILFGLFGLGLIVAGLFVTDPLNGPPTLHGAVHNYVTLVVFLSLIAVSFVLARRFAGDLNWKNWAAYSVITGILVAAFFIATNVASHLNQNGVLHGAPVGLLQRSAIIIGWGWVALFAFRLLRAMLSPVVVQSQRDL